MLLDPELHTQQYDSNGAPHALLDFADEIGGFSPRPNHSATLHERKALASALDDGLMPDEVAHILAGRRVAEAFPVRWGESPEAYAYRVVSDMFIAYLQ